MLRISAARKRRTCRVDILLPAPICSTAVFSQGENASDTTGGASVSIYPSGIRSASETMTGLKQSIIKGDIMPVHDREILTPHGVCHLTEAEVTVTLPGLCREYTFVHISDLHISASDAGDSDEEKERAACSEKFWRTQGCITCGRGGDEYVMTPLEANETVAERIREISPDMVFLTGDVVNYASLSSLRRAKEYIDSLGCGCIFAPGNHDAVPDAMRDEARRLAAELAGGDPEFQILSLSGFDIAAIDDSDIKISNRQLHRMQEQIKAKRPAILLLHVPLQAPAARAPVLEKWGPDWMIGEEQQCENNRLFLKLINDNKDVVRAVFAGHVHIATGDDEMHDGGIVQYTAAPCFTGFLRIIRVKGA